MKVIRIDLGLVLAICYLGGCATHSESNGNQKPEYHHMNQSSAIQQAPNNKGMETASKMISY